MRPQTVRYRNPTAPVPPKLTGGAFVNALPAKLVDEHRWITACSYAITPEQAHAAVNGSAIALDRYGLIQMGVGCWDCGLDYSDGAGKPCKPSK